MICILWVVKGVFKYVNDIGFPPSPARVQLVCLSPPPLKESLCPLRMEGITGWTLAVPEVTEEAQPEDPVSVRAEESHLSCQRLVVVVFQSLSQVSFMARLLCTWDFPRQEYWSGLPFPSPGDLPDPRIELGSPSLAGRFSTTDPDCYFPVNSQYTPLYFRAFAFAISAIVFLQIPERLASSPTSYMLKCSTTLEAFDEA